MGAPQCKQCKLQKEELDLINYSNFKTITQIEEQYRKYAQTNMLGFYSIRVQKAIQKLYTLDQIDLCNLIVKLSCNKMTEKRDRMLDDLDSIDLQQLDHLSILQVLPKNVQSQYNEAGSIFYDHQDPQIINNPSLSKKSTANSQYSIKIMHKHNLKNDSQSLGKEQQKKFFILATVGCFNNNQILKSLSLPTKKTALRMFLQKVQGFNTHYQANVLVVFIVNPHFQSVFDKEIASYQSQFREKQKEAFTPRVKFQKVIYKPIYPCVNLQRKIAVTAQEDILFDYLGGDLIGFIMKNPRLQIILQKYEYFQFANISNLLQKIGQPQILVYLYDNIEVDVIAPVVPNDSQSLRVVKHFIDKIRLNPKSTHKNPKQLTHSFYVRSMLLFNKHSHFQKLISMRIRSEGMSQPSIINFSRTFEQILYSPITLLLVCTKEQFAASNNRQIQYSNYCKSVLGITQTKEQQIVQICPQILFGPKSQIKVIISELSNLSSVGFPLVFSNQKQQKQK